MLFKESIPSAYEYYNLLHAVSQRVKDLSEERLKVIEANEKLPF